MLLRRVRRSLGVVAVAMITSASVVVAAGPAQALQPDPLTVKTVEGIARALGPKVAARYAVAGSVCGTGVGCPAGIIAGIGITAYELYQHQDVWMPWVKGLFGEATSENMCSTAPWTIGNCPADIEAWVSTTSSGLNIVGHYSNTITSYIRMEATCRNPDGTTYFQGFNAGKPNGTGSHSFAMCASGTSLPGRTFQEVKYLQCPSSAYTGCTQKAIWSRAGPVQSIDSVIKCKKPDGSTYLVAQVTSNPVDGVHVRSCDPGDVPVDLTYQTSTKTGSPIPLQNDAQHDSEYPLCAGALGKCGYQIRVDGLKCQIAVYNCVHWSHIATNFPARVRCEYGPYVVDLTDCAFMERAYEPTQTSNPSTGWVPVNSPNTDGDPTTWTPPAPQPPYQPGSSPTPTPTPTPTGTPTTSPSPQPSPTLATPTPSGSPSIATDLCKSPYALGQVDPGAVKVANQIGSAYNFAREHVGGYRTDADGEGDHTAGLAIDFMVFGNTGLGDSVATFAQQNAPNLGIRYIIWKQRIWNIERADEGWRPMADRGSPTENHMDHVHITVYPMDLPEIPGGVDCQGDPGDRPEDDNGECFPTGWGIFNPVQWVYKPVMCALKDAFKPDPDATMGSLNRIKDLLASKGPGPAITQIGALFDAVPDEAGCAGPPMTFTLNDHPYTVNILNACTEPMKTVARYSKTLTTLLISVSGSLALIRAVAAGFGFSFSMGGASRGD